MTEQIFNVTTVKTAYEAAVKSSFDDSTEFFNSCLNKLLSSEDSMSNSIKASHMCFLSHWGNIGCKYPEMMAKLRIKISYLLKQFDNTHDLKYWKYYVFLCDVSSNELDYINTFEVYDNKNKHLAKKMFLNGGALILLDKFIDNNRWELCKYYIDFLRNPYYVFLTLFELEPTKEELFTKRITSILKIYRMKNDLNKIENIFESLKKDMLERNLFHIYEKIQQIYFSYAD